MIGTALLGSDIENKVLRVLQEGIPLEIEPFKTLSRDLDIEEDYFIEVIHDLKERKIIRQISPIYDTRMLGYDSLLVAFKISPGNIDSVAELINSHPGVSHSYERNHSFNLWFTLAIPPDSRFGPEGTVEALASTSGVREYLILRAKRVFKIELRLDPEGSGLEQGKCRAERKEFPSAFLTEEQKEIIRVTQEDMPVVKMPFSLYAMRLGIDEGDLLKRLDEFREKGIMRRFAAVLYHRNAGFSANGMVVWRVPASRLEEVGLKIASYRAVSHCYERTTNSHWPYNLFSMIHAKERERVREIVEEIQRETAIDDYAILYSTREFKKRRVRYFEKDFYEWEARFNGRAESFLL
ncbi:MAG: AsnC family transcriptional regulator [Thermodesulfovibrionales bacterium]